MLLVATMASAMLDKLSGLGIACLRKELELNDLTHGGVVKLLGLTKKKMRTMGKERGMTAVQ